MNRAGAMGKHFRLWKERGWLVSDCCDAPITPGEGNEHHCSSSSHLLGLSEAKRHNRELPLPSTHTPKQAV